MLSGNRTFLGDLAPCYQLHFSQNVHITDGMAQVSRLVLPVSEEVPSVTVIGIAAVECHMKANKILFLLRISHFDIFCRKRV
jgi:hypothetical protein